MSRDSSFDDIAGERCGLCYSLSTSHYEKTKGRGRSMVDINYRNKLRLAAHVVEIQEKVMPLGYMPTSQEMLEENDVNEITPLLRKLGINGNSDELNTQNTRKVVVEDADIRIEGNVPIILNSELFAMINDDQSVINRTDDEIEKDEPYDPSRPLHEQFTTIKEFMLPMTPVKKESTLLFRNSSSDSSDSSEQTRKSNSTESFSPPSSSNYDESSWCSNNTSDTFESDEDSNEDIFHPLLETKEKFHTSWQSNES